MYISYNNGEVKKDIKIHIDRKKQETNTFTN